MNVARWIERAALRRGESPALAHGDTVVRSYAELALRCAGLAAGLRRRHGLEPGDRVAIVAKNHPAYLEAMFGAWWGGLVVVPVNAKLHPAEISWILGHCEAKAAFASPDMADAIGDLEPDRGTAFIPLVGELVEELASTEPIDLVPTDANDLAWLFYTSGTTGRPKGAMLSHRNLVAMSLAHLVDVDPTLPGEALIHAAPLSHASGMLSLPHVCRMGVNVVPESGRFEAAETLALIECWRGASLFLAPTMIRRLVDCPEAFDPAAIRTIVWGGAPMHVADTERALQRLGPRLAQIYGQGETPMTISALAKDEIGDMTHPRWRERLSSAGTVRSNVEVRVAGEQGLDLAPGETGEVLVRGDTVMDGYWRDAEATGVALRDGWLHTGDLGSFDRDGYLTLLDRSKDLIISGGTNIYPREVEEVLVSHPLVREVSVIGRPDAEWGEVVVAYVVGAVDSDELDRLCLERIARFKRPKAYVFLDSLPKSSYGKVLKRELRKLDEERLGAAPCHPPLSADGPSAAS